MALPFFADERAGIKIAPFRVFSTSCEEENFPSAPSDADSNARGGDVARRGDAVSAGRGSRGRAKP